MYELIQVSDKTFYMDFPAIIESPKPIDDILADVFDCFGLTMSIQKNVLIGNTARSYLNCLKR